MDRYGSDVAGDVEAETAEYLPKVYEPGDAHEYLRDREHPVEEARFLVDHHLPLEDLARLYDQLEREDGRCEGEAASGTTISGIGKTSTQIKLITSPSVLPRLIIREGLASLEAQLFSGSV